MSKHLFIQFDKDHQKVFKIAGIEIIRPDTWTNRDEDGTESDKYGYNVNMKDVHPQIATVMRDNRQQGYVKGDRVFLHYMAKETEEIAQVGEEVYSVVPADFVFFKIEGDKIVMADNMYLGEQLYSEAVTPSGIYMTPTGVKKDVLKVKILHTPKRVSSEYGELIPEEYRYRWPTVKVGDVVCTCDDYQYILKYEGKEYIKLLDREIVLTFTKDATT